MILPPLEPQRPAAISRRSPEQREEDPVDFVALRRLAVRLAQATGGDTWTDYNLHDPGVTILEAVCYAMTELAYRADFPVADQLTQADGTIHFRRQALFPPDEILPCRPTSAQDYRRLFFDRVPELGDIRFETPDARTLAGVQRLRLRLGFRTGRETQGTARGVRDAVRNAYLAHRGFGEDIDGAIRPIRLRLCDLKLEAEIEGMRDPLEIAAEIYDNCAARVAGLVRPRPFDALLRANVPLEEIFDGPSWVNGVVPAEAVEGGGRLALSELRGVILGVPGVSSVTSLELPVLPPDAEPSRAVLDWDPALVAYRLRVPGVGPEGADTLKLTLRRRGVIAPLDPQALARRFADRVRPGRAAGHGARGFEAARPAPVGLHHPPLAYRSVREHFPRVYGLQEAERDRWMEPANDEEAVAAAAARTAQDLASARADQLKAYLAFFDHVLVNGAAQLDHVADLFSVDGGRRHDGWRRLLTNAEASGVERLYLQPTPALTDEVFGDYDDIMRRRDVALDFLLSLHGETLAQNTSRQFLDYLDSRELAAELLANKAEYLRQMVCIGRDRAAGFDYGQRLWAEREVTPGLHRRIGLLLGFRTWAARPLTRGAGDWAPGEADAPVTDVDDLRQLTWPDPGHHPPAPRRAPPRAGLHGPLFADGLRRARYLWRSKGSGPAGTLYLARGPAEDDAHVRTQRDAWWKLGDFTTEALAAAYANRLRRDLIEATDAHEGLHVVEHVLLRPRGRRAPVDPAFHALRATLVFPNWTARTSRPAFQAFARETVLINAPAHVRAECLFLDFAAMAQFEGLYERWLEALHAAASAHRLRALDDASAALEAFLRRHLPDGGA